jgi:hypothetical protein
MAQDFLFDHHVGQGIVPAADRFAGGVSSDIVSLANYKRCTFFIFTGAIEDSGISNLVTVDACDNTTPSNTTAVSFKHRSQQWSTTVDTWSSLTSATSSGYNFMTNNAVANAVHMIEVNSSDVEAEAPGKPYVRLTIAETVNKTITAAVFWVLSEPRYPQPVPVQAIA